MLIFYLLGLVKNHELQYLFLNIPSVSFLLWHFLAMELSACTTLPFPTHIATSKLTDMFS